MKEIGGFLEGKGLKIAIASTRFNSFLTERLIEGALDALVRHGVSRDDLVLVRCPGAFELPLIVQKLAQSQKYDAVIALGAVIRGDTPHFDYVAGEVSKGIAHVSLNTNVPVIFGVLTTDTLEQAEIRLVCKGSNKGFEAGMTAIEMCQIMKKI